MLRSVRRFNGVHPQGVFALPSSLIYYLDTWMGASFIQILTRAGYVVFQLDNLGSAFRGTAIQAPIHGKLGISRANSW